MVAKGVVMLRSRGAPVRRNWSAMFGCGRFSERGGIGGAVGEVVNGGGECFWVEGGWTEERRRLRFDCFVSMEWSLVQTHLNSPPDVPFAQHPDCRL